MTVYINQAFFYYFLIDGDIMRKLRHSALSIFFYSDLWINVSLNNVHFQVFTGNTDTDTIKYNYFRGTFETRFLKLYLKDYNTAGFKCLRIEVYGCKDNAGEWINVWINVCMPNVAATFDAPWRILLLLINYEQLIQPLTFSKRWCTLRHKCNEI